MERNASGPMAIIVESPIAESIEYRPPTQSQNPNMCAVSMPKEATSSAFVEIATKCQPGQQPRARGAGVRHRLECREGLRGDEEQRLRGIEVAHGLREVGPVDVGDEAEGQGAVRVVPERLEGHHRAEVRAPDPDVDHVADALSRVSLPRAPADPVREVRHAVEHLVDGRHDVLSVDADRGGPGGAQRDVEDRAILRHVDLPAREHGVDALAQARLGRQLDEVPHRLVGDAVLGVVQVDPGRVQRQALAAPGVALEQVAQVHVRHVAVVGDERLPGCAATKPQYVHGASPADVAPASTGVPCHVRTDTS